MAVWSGETVLLGDGRALFVGPAMVALESGRDVEVSAAAACGGDGDAGLVTVSRGTDAGVVMPEAIERDWVSTGILLVELSRYNHSGRAGRCA